MDNFLLDRISLIVIPFIVIRHYYEGKEAGLVLREVIDFWVLGVHCSHCLNRGQHKPAWNWAQVSNPYWNWPTFYFLVHNVCRRFSSEGFAPQTVQFDEAGLSVITWQTFWSTMVHIILYPTLYTVSLIERTDHKRASSREIR